jgi:hypothetical protein
MPKNASRPSRNRRERRHPELIGRPKPLSAATYPTEPFGAGSQTGA